MLTAFPILTVHRPQSVEGARDLAPSALMLYQRLRFLLSPRLAYRLTPFNKTRLRNCQLVAGIFAEKRSQARPIAGLWSEFQGFLHCPTFSFN